jgi:hypothetical protein
MPPPKNRRFAAELRRHQVAELYLQGSSQTAIAEKLNVAQSTICSDLAHCQKTWRAAANKDFTEIRAQELKHLDLIIREAWAGWIRSQKPAQSAVVSDKPGSQHSRKTMKNQVGDPRFLDLVAKCILQKRQMLGLDVPPPIPVLDDPADANISLEARQQRIQSLLVAMGIVPGLGAAGTGSGGLESGQLRIGNEQRSLGDSEASDGSGPGDSRYPPGM